jgi:predicted Zn-ribbon and HTH transcriptional regulator
MIKKIKDWISSFRDSNKTIDLGKLQKAGYIPTLPDMSACPNCKSKNIKWSFLIPTDGSKPTLDGESICKDCGYSDKKGEFELTNKSIYRQEKINKILNS